MNTATASRHQLIAWMNSNEYEVWDDDSTEELRRVVNNLQDAERRAEQHDREFKAWCQTTKPR